MDLPPLKRRKRSLKVKKSVSTDKDEDQPQPKGPVHVEDRQTEIPVKNAIDLTRNSQPEVGVGDNGAAGADISDSLTNLRQTLTRLLPSFLNMKANSWRELPPITSGCTQQEETAVQVQINAQEDKSWSPLPSICKPCSRRTQCHHDPLTELYQHADVKSLPERNVDLKVDQSKHEAPDMGHSSRTVFETAHGSKDQKGYQRDQKGYERDQKVYQKLPEAVSSHPVAGVSNVRTEGFSEANIGLELSTPRGSKPLFKRSDSKSVSKEETFSSDESKLFEEEEESYEKSTEQIEEKGYQEKLSTTEKETSTLPSCPLCQKKFNTGGNIGSIGHVEALSLSDLTWRRHPARVFSLHACIDTLNSENQDDIGLNPIIVEDLSIRKLSGLRLYSLSQVDIDGHIAACYAAEEEEIVQSQTAKLPSCPLCQTMFNKSLSQVDIDAHIAACFAAADDDVMW